MAKFEYGNSVSQFKMMSWSGHNRRAAAKVDAIGEQQLKWDERVTEADCSI